MEDIIRNNQNSGMKSAFIVDHNYGGGSNFYRSDLLKSYLKNNKRCYLLCNPIPHFKIDVLTENTREEYEFQNLEQVERFLSNIQLDEIFFNNCFTFEDPLLIPDFLIRIKKQHNATLTIALHDFFSVCPSFSLLNNKSQFCNIPDIKECNACSPFNSNTLYHNISITKWREHWGACLEAACAIQYYSHTSRQLLLKAYPELDQTKISFKPHSLDYFPVQSFANRKTYKNLHIGFVGNLEADHKGKDIIIGIVQHIEQNQLDVAVTIIGEFPSLANHKSVTVVGEYEREKLPDYIYNSGVNVFFVPSICSETFSYVTHELIKLQLPVATFNLGAQGEAVAKYEKGRVIPKVDAVFALSELMEFHQQIS